MSTPVLQRPRSTQSNLSQSGLVLPASTSTSTSLKGSSGAWLSPVEPQTMPNPIHRYCYICLWMIASYVMVYIIFFAQVFHSDVPVEMWNNSTPPWKIWPGVGFCRNGSSLLHGIDDSICVRRECLYSAKLKINVDINKLLNYSNKRFDTEYLRWKGVKSQCFHPKGGQLPTSQRKEVEVTFLYTLHNHASLAASSILEVFRTAHEASSAEFVIIDDGSGDDMTPVTRLLQNLEDIFEIVAVKSRHLTPKGYLYSNNEGLQDGVASGEYAVLLNSDVLVLPGWLKMLMRTMRTFPGGKVGMVGPMMLDKDGVISEAGGGMFRYGIPYNSGRAAKPLDQAQLQARVVDYVSAACLLVRRKLFLSLGLFDPAFAPAYYEDTDAALVHEQNGWKTVFQPFSVVQHFEGSTYTSAAKQVMMDDNGRKFQQKHNNLLQHYCPIPNSHAHGVNTSPKVLDVHMGATFYRQLNRVLVLEDVVPEPDRDAGSIRLYALLQILSEMGYSVTFEAQPIIHRNVRYLLQLFSEGINAVVPGTLHDMAEASKTPFHNRLRSLGADLCPWQAIIIARRDVFTRHIADVKQLCPNTPIIFDTVDVHFIRERRMHNLTNFGTLADIEAGEARELDYMRIANITLVVSTEEQRILRRKLGEQADIRVISNIYSTLEEEEARKDHGESPESLARKKEQRRDPKRRAGAVFVGNMCHHPNVDAVDFIMRNVLRNTSILPSDFRMHFVWSRSLLCENPMLEQAARHPLVVVHRDISNEQLQKIHEQVKVVLAPLRFGAGVKGKVNYGLLHGVPVIATPMASEGMGLQNERHFLRATTGDEFVKQILRIYADDNLFRLIAQNGQDVMKEFFGREVAKARLHQAFQDLHVPAGKDKHFVCPNLAIFDAHSDVFGSNYWQTVPNHLRSSHEVPGGPFFPLYPRLPYTEKFLQFV